MICANPECEAHYHTYCYEQIKQAGRDKCAACQTRFSENEPQPLGELSVPRREDQWGTLNNRRKRRQRDEEDGIEDEEAEEEELDSEDEVEVSASQCSTAPTSLSATSIVCAFRVANRTHRQSQSQSQSRSQSQSQSQRETIVPGSIPDESEPPRTRRRR